MSPLRKARSVLFWLHLSAGLTAGLVILLQAVTGIVLALEHPLLDRSEDYALSVSTQKELSPEELATHAVAVHHEGLPLSGLSRQAGSAQPYVFAFGRERSLFLDPWSGKVLGEGSPRLRAFFAWVTTLHRCLALPDTARDSGKAITGAASLVFLFMVLSGLCLWWPRRWSCQHLKRIVFFQSRYHGPARRWNWHHVFGFWLCMPLFIIALTGVIMSYDWANRLLYQAAGSPPPENSAEGGGRGGRGGKGGKKEGAVVSTTGLNRAWALATAKVPHWQSINVRLPSASGGPAVFAISEGPVGRPDLKSQLNVDLGTGAEQSFETFASQPRGKQWRQWSRWMHTGEAGGMAGQIVAGIAAFGAAMLVYTGFALTARRLRGKKK
jgi:uncharacterized iron-regulated membrane protein